MKKIMLLLLFSILLVGTISALEFDNVKTYDEATKTVTIENAFGLGDDIVYGTLKTPQVNHVGIGYQKVAEFEVLANKDYEGLLKQFELINNKNGESIERNIDIKYKSYEKILGDIETCEDIKGEQVCTVTGQEEIQRVVWKPYNNSVKAGDKVTIGLFTDVSQGDEVEWIPSIAGVKVNEWATWVGGFETGMVGFYRFESEDGSIVDETGYNNGTTAQATNTSGVVGYTYEYNKDLRSYGNITDANNGLDLSGDFTIAVWIKYNSSNSGDRGFISKEQVGSDGWMVYWDDAAKSFQLFSYGIGDSNIGSGALREDVYYHLIIDYDGTNKNIYINNSLNVTEGTSGTIGANALDVWVANYHNSNTRTSMRIDELGFWNRTLTSAERGYLFNKTAYEIITPPADNSPYYTGWDLVNNSNYTTNTFNINSTWYDDRLIDNVSVYIDGTINQTNSSVFNGSLVDFDVVLPDGTHTIYMQGWDNASQSNSTGTIYFNIDTTNPAIEIFNPNTTKRIDNYVTNTSVWNGLNYSATDNFLDSCWYSTDGGTTNTTLGTCANVTRIYLDYGTYTFDVWVNDTFGKTNHSSVTKEFTYKVIQNDESYTSHVLEGSTQTYKLNITIGTGYNYSTGNIYFNNSFSTLTSDYIAEDNFTLSRTLTMPTVTVDTNKTFLYQVILNDSSQVNSSTFQQQIQDLTIDDCTNNTYTLYNFTMENEGLQTYISNGDDSPYNTTGEVEINLYSYATTDSILDYSKRFSKTNPFRVCLNNSLSGGEKYNLDGIIRYYTNSSVASTYETEYYHLQNETIDSNDIATNITLYLLNSSDSQVFELTARDSSFLAVSDALIEIYRKYIDEGEYKIVEIPKTSNDGTTLGHLVVEDVIYKFIVKKYGKTIGTFEDVKAVCPNPTIETCSIDFNAPPEDVNIDDLYEKSGISYSLSWNNNTRTVSSFFTLTNTDSSEWVTLNVSQTDALGTDVCSDSITATTGTLSCSVPTTIGNSTVKAYIYRSGSYVGGGFLDISKTPKQIYGAVIVTLALFALLTLIGASISDSPVFTIVFLMIGIFLMMLLNLYANDGFIGGSATILFLVGAVILLVIKTGSGRFR